MDFAPTAHRPGPWFQSHRVLSLSVAGLLFAAISISKVYVDTTGAAMTILFVLPIALLAVTFGLRGGLAGATLGFLLFAGFALFHDSGAHGVVGWLARATAMFLLGGLLGEATDRARMHEQRALYEQRRRYELEVSARRQRAAMEINDSLIQGIAAAKWLAEDGHYEEALKLLGDTIERGERLVSAMLAQTSTESIPSVLMPLEHDGQPEQPSVLRPGARPPSGRRARQVTR